MDDEWKWWSKNCVDLEKMRNKSEEVDDNEIPTMKRSDRFFNDDWLKKKISCSSFGEYLFR